MGDRRGWIRPLVHHPDLFSAPRFGSRMRRSFRIHSRRAFVMLIRATLVALVSVAVPALAESENTHWPHYQEGDFTISNYKFASGETLPQLNLHYRTLGSAERNGAGEIVNGVLLLQGNTGTGANWLRPSLPAQ